VPVLMAQIYQESTFNAKAKSPAGALGPLQFMPGTAKWAANAGNLGPAMPSDPAWAVRAGSWYDKFLYDRVVYLNDCDKWGAALSSYNGGLGWHNRRQQIADDPFDFWNEVRTINPGVSDGNQLENALYPVKIIAGQARWMRVGDRKVCP
jgi:soluble lytic murein transglycosylase-like protein